MNIAFLAADCGENVVIATFWAIHHLLSQSLSCKNDVIKIEVVQHGPSAAALSATALSCSQGRMLLNQHCQLAV